MATVKKDDRLTSSQSLLCVGFAGVFSKTVTSPLEVVKILSQIGTFHCKRGFLQSFVFICQNEGLRAFWKGNMVSCLRLFPYSAIHLTTYKKSFPGLFRNGRKRPSTSVSSRFASLSNKKWKPFDLSIFLLSSNDELTPLPSDELAFMQAGLGKRTVSLDRDLTHVELSRLLQATYPKMVELQDRWLLYKAGGGNGRRKMSAIPLEAEGYTGAMLRKVSGGGKSTLYIVPLQDELDLSPLPANAPEFALMPKASCKHCFAEMPLQMLALHDCKCASHTSPDLEIISDDDDDDVQFPEVLQTPVPVQMTEEDHCPQQKGDVQCPICGISFPVLLIEEHASHCGQRTEDTTSPERELHPETDDISCEEDVIMWLKSKVDTSKTFELCVSRDNMFERGLKLWKRNKKATPINPLRIKFLGEAGIDTGALRKEFLTTMVSGIEQRLFEGVKSKMPKYSVNDFDEELFRIAGEIFATSIAQGGPAPRFLQRWCYNFLVSGKLSLDQVRDPSLSPLITTVAEASDMTDYIADIMDCGYTGKIDMEHKENILRAIGLHVMTKRMPMLQQLREGLDLYGFSQVMQAKTEECRSLFVAGDDESVDSYYITSHLAPVMSERGCNKHHKETQILEHFQDFLHELEVAEPDATSEDITTVPSVMQWITGQAHRHLLLSDRQNFKITVKFDHDCHKMPNHTICYPTVSACTDTITFPVAHMSDYGSFKNVMTTAIKYGAGFDRA